MAKNKASSKIKRILRLCLGVFLFLLGTVALILLVLLIEKIIAGFIALLGVLIALGNWTAWLVNFVALKPVVQKIRYILPSPPREPVIFYVFYHYSPIGTIDRIRYYVNFIVKPALEEACECTVIPIPLNKKDNLQLWTRNTAKSTHAFFVLTNKFFKNVIDAVFEEEMLRIANLARANREGSIIFVDQSDRQKDFLNKSVAAVSVYEDLRTGQHSAAKKKITALVPYRYLRSAVGSAPPPVLTPPPTNTETSEPIWEVPFEKNPDFFDREDDQYNLPSILSKLTAGNANILVLYGMNGAGKTETVRAYAYEYGPRNEDTEQDCLYQWVLWVDASIGLENGCRRLNEQLNKGHPEFPFPALENQIYVQELIKLQAWLYANEKNLPSKKKWLLIIDRCERQNFEFENAKDILHGFERGHIIYTMRENPGRGDYVRQQVGGMNDDDGFHLLVHSSGRMVSLSSEEEQNARAIVQALGGNPLAIANAGAYISNEMTFKRYLEIYQHELLYVKERKRFLKDQLKIRPIGADIQESVATTFRLSFAEIEGDKNGAEEILLLCAFLGPTKIPIEVITSMPRKHGEDPFPSQFNDALEKLRNLSFIKDVKDDQGKTFYLEKIIRDIIRADLYPVVSDKLEETKKWYRSVAVHAVSAAFLQVLYGKGGEQGYLYLIKKSGYDPAEKFGFADLGNLYLPHVFECFTRHIQSMKADHAVTLSAVQLLYITAEYLQSNPQHEKQYSLDARSLFEEALKLRKWSGLPDHAIYPSVPTCLNGVAGIYYDRFLNGDIASLSLAEDHLQEALIILTTWPRQSQRQYSDSRNVDEASVLNNLARVLEVRGKHEDARKELRRARKIRNRTLSSGATGLSRIALLLNKATILNNLAGIYVGFGDRKAAEAEETHNQNKHAEAEEIKRKARRYYGIAMRGYDVALERVLSETKQLLEHESASLQKAACERQLRLQEVQLKANRATLLVCQGSPEGYAEAEKIYLDINNELKGMREQFRQEDGYVLPEICLQLAMQWNNLMELYRIQKQFEKAKGCQLEIYDHYSDYTRNTQQEQKPGNLLRFVIRDNVDELVKYGNVMSRQEIDKYQDYRSNYFDVAQRA